MRKCLSLSAAPQRKAVSGSQEMFCKKTALPPMNSALPSTLSSSSTSSLSLLKFTKIPLSELFNATSYSPVALLSINPKLRRRRREWITLSESNENPSSVAVASPSATNIDEDSSVDSASDVVRNFYGGINAQDLDSVKGLIAENCVYEDLVFPRPFVGRTEILEFFKKFTTSASRDLQFIIDNLSTEDSSSVGVIWHLEWKGKPFPFSKGCSFYQLEVINGKRQIIYGRDSVEPAFKPGDAALVAIRSVTWLLQQFPQLADRL